MSFRIESLPMAPFRRLMALGPDALRRAGAEIRVAATQPGYPCRVSLRDADPGDELLLCNFTHQPAVGPYRARGPVFVRREAVRAVPAPGHVPDMLRDRTLSVRAYDSRHSLVRAEVVDGGELEGAIERALGTRAAEYLHVHFAGPGCYACRVVAA